MSSLITRFGITVRQLRAERGWSQLELSGRARLDRSYLGEIERGTVVVSLVTVEKLATALEVDATDLLGRCAELAALRERQHAQLTAIAR